MRSSKVLILLLCTLPLAVLAQNSDSYQKDITGLWTGTLFNDTTSQYSKYEVAISREKGKLVGFSHTYFIIDGKEYYGVKKVNVKKAPDGKIIIVDEELVLNNYPGLPAKYTRQLNVLTFNNADSAVVLSGPFVTNRTKQFHALTGSVHLTRNNGAWQSALWPHLQDLGKEKAFSYRPASTPFIASSSPNYSGNREAEKNK
jgi:hypothetical protein